MTNPKLQPMDPGDIDELREVDSWHDGDWSQAESLISAHDYWQARAARMERERDELAERVRFLESHTALSHAEHLQATEEERELVGNGEALSVNVLREIHRRQRQSLLARVARMERERDDARRFACLQSAKRVHGSSASDEAETLGWGYLYPESEAGQ